MVKLNFEDVDKVLPEGIYHFRIKSASVEQNKSNEGQHILLKCQVIDDPEWEGREVWERPSLSAKALWKLRDVLEAITKQPWRDNNMDLDVPGLAGLTFTGAVVHESYLDEKTQTTKISPRINSWMADNEQPQFAGYKSL